VSASATRRVPRRLQRLQADFENYRKRVARSSEDAADRAAGHRVDPAAGARRVRPRGRALRGADSEEAEALDPGARPAARRPAPRRASSASTRSVSSSTPRCTTPSRTSRARVTATRGRRGAARRIPMEGFGPASRDGESEGLTRWPNESGSTRTTTRSSDSPRAPPRRRSPAPIASWPSPAPRHQSRLRGEVQGGLGRLRRARRRRQAQGVRRGPTSRPGRGGLRHAGRTRRGGLQLQTGDFGDLGDIFGGLFGGGATPAGPTRRRPRDRAAPGLSRRRRRASRRR
jgi:hypothetical protein